MRTCPYLAALILSLSLPAYAMNPVVRVEVTPPAVTVGKKVDVKLTILVPTWFMGPPDYPSLEMANAIVRLPPDSSYPVSEPIEGETWAGITRHYEIVPLLAADFKQSIQTISVSYADSVSRQAVKAEVPLPAFEFNAYIPPGAERLSPYLAGETFTVKRHIEGDLSEIIPGDVVVVTYVATLKGLPAIFIPELAPDFGDGFSVYPAEPEVSSGETSTRNEKITLIARQSGDLSIPESTYSWWNLATRQIETISLEPIINDPVGSLQADPAIGRSAMAYQWEILGLGSIIVAITALFVIRYRRKMAADENVAFRRLEQSLKATDAKSVYRDLGIWVQACGHPTGLRSWLEMQHDDVLQNQIEALSANLYSSAETSVNYDIILKQLYKSRRSVAMTNGYGTYLPALNPRNNSTPVTFYG